ncbi:MAG: hypothetical protein ACQKBW_06490, partial [Puniceicoccales bacterium]
MTAIRYCLALVALSAVALLLSGCPAKPEAEVVISEIPDVPLTYTDFLIVSPTQGVVSPEDLKLVPGEILTLVFPNLPRMVDEQVSTCEVRIPEDYKEDESVPLLVWMTHQLGSSHVIRAEGVADFSKFLVVALPYPLGKRPRIAVED